MSSSEDQEPPSSRGESSRQGPEERQQQSGNEHEGESGGDDGFPYQQRAGGASYDGSLSSSPTGNVPSMGGYPGLPPFPGYMPEQQQGGLTMPGPGQYAPLPPFPSGSGLMYSQSAPASYGSRGEHQDRRPSHDSIGGPSHSTTTPQGSQAMSRFAPQTQQSGTGFQSSPYPGGFLSGGGGRSNDPSPILPYQQPGLPPMRPGFQTDLMYGMGSGGPMGSGGFGGSGYSSDGAGSMGFRDEGEASRGMGILPPHGAVRSASGSNIPNMGRRGNRRSFGGARSGPGGPDGSGSSPHQHPLGSNYFPGGASEGVSAALSMTGGPGYQGPPPPGGDGGASPMSMYPPHDPHWYGHPMDYPPPGAPGFVPGFLGELGPPYPSYPPEGYPPEYPPPGERGPPPGEPIQLNPNVQYGPEGSNLFIFHVPNEWHNRDMFDAFCPFGLPISVRIAVENGRSKGYGFVSYDNPESAALAIQQMAGFETHGKRLKVQHKRIEGDDRDRMQGGRGGGRGRGYYDGGRGGGGRGWRQRGARSSPIDQRALGDMPPPGGIMPPSGMMVSGGPESDFGPAPYHSAEGVLQSMLPPRANPPSPAPSAAGAASTTRRPQNEPMTRPAPQQSSTSEGSDSPPADIRTQVLPPFPPVPQDDPQSQEHDSGSCPPSGNSGGDVFDLTQLGSELPPDVSSR